MPIAWEGWLLLIGLLVFAMLPVIVSVLFHPARPDLVFAGCFACGIGGILCMVPLVRNRTREGWRWRWGNPL
ncbi:hypothetical protein [Swaminathania salitolerans]|uniref:Uncharacterized protein n=1 Tax=Swaminathania salitolerans TaxID=182838 RepID=A0A511BMA2_9PROT|nr:hypothetical protein [Swaminathania salitolerans]GEL01467.1 hypothetical protein SSA02_06300 [Swaminathania salitolerans]